MQTTGNTVVLMCSDVVGEDGPISIGAISRAVSGRAPACRLVTVRDLCSRRGALPEALLALQARRAVVCCGNAARSREEIRASLARFTVRLEAAEIVDLSSTAEAEPGEVFEQAVARLRSALARISCSETAAFVPRGRRTSRPSRRQVLALSTRDWAAEATESCSIVGLEAEATSLVAEASRLAAGVAVMCSKVTLPLGSRWLPLQVPSLEMVTAGWPLQIVSEGVPVRLLSCGDEPCAHHGVELTAFCAQVLEALAPEQSRLLLGGGESALTHDPRPAPGDAVSAVATARSITLREPQATIRALSALASGGRGEISWQVESALSPLGEVRIDASACSACGCCVSACPTSALAIEGGDEDHPVRITFEPASCSGCGACVPACPEGVVALRQLVGSASLAPARLPLVEVTPDERCISCGRPLLARLSIAPVAGRLAGSHPEVARLLSEGRCADCVLAGVPLTASMTRLHEGGADVNRLPSGDLCPLAGGVP